MLFLDVSAKTNMSIYEAVFSTALTNKDKCGPSFHTADLSRGKTKCVASWQGAISVPLAYLDGFDLDFAQVHFLDLQKCCWLVHLEAHFSVAALVIQTRQIFHLSSLLNEATEINVLCSDIKVQLWS